MSEKPEDPLERLKRRSRLERLTSWRDEYADQVKQHVELYEKALNEGWWIYNSSLTGPGKDAYFSTDKYESWSFTGLDGFNAEKLTQHIISFLKQPENVGREIIVLDAFGTGRPGRDLRDMVVKKIPTAHITVMATTLTPGRDNPGDIIEFNGNILSEKSSRPLFDDIDARRANGAALLVTFFRPGGALAGAYANSFLQFKLYEHLRRLFSLTAEHGLLFLQSPSDRGEVKFLRELLSHYNAEKLLVTKHDSTGLLKKESRLAPDASLPKKDGELAFPSPDELLQEHPSLVRRYWNLTD